MNRILRRMSGGTAVALGFAAMATVALAQMPGSQPSDEASQASGDGYQMMGGYSGSGYPGMGPGMMGGQGPGAHGGPGFPAADRLAALKSELNITSGETDAWNAYAAASAAARKQLWDGMRSIWQPAANGTWTPDQRFEAMDKMVALMKQGYEQEKQAADTLTPHLTPFQQGQAKEILPGLAASAWGAGRGCGPMQGGMGW